MAQTNVQIWRRGVAAPLKTMRVEIPTSDETSDAVRSAVLSAVAQFGSVSPKSVSLNHRLAGGFLAYLPAIKNGR